MIPSSAARRYAQAAFDVARADATLPQWLETLREASRTYQDPSTRLFFKDPNIPHERKLEAIDTLLSKVPEHPRNLLRMLAVRNRLHLLPALIRELEALDREEKGIVQATVTVARPLSESEQRDIGDRLGRSTGKSVELSVTVEPAIIGGVVVRIGDEVIDSSVAGRLERLRHDMAV